MSKDNINFFDSNQSNSFLFFNVSNNEVLRISSDGFYIRGEKVNDNDKIYKSFVHWLNSGVGYNVEEDVVIRKEDFKNKLIKFLREGLEIRTNDETLRPKIHKFIELLNMKG